MKTKDGYKYALWAFALFTFLCYLYTVGSFFYWIYKVIAL